MSYESLPDFCVCVLTPVPHAYLHQYRSCLISYHINHLPCLEPFFPLPPPLPVPMLQPTLIPTPMQEATRLGVHNCTCPLFSLSPPLLCTCACTYTFNGAGSNQARRIQLHLPSLFPYHLPILYPCCNPHFYLGLARTIYIYGVYTVFLAGKSPNIRSYGVYIRFWPTLLIPTHRCLLLLTSIGLARTEYITAYDHIFGDSPAKYTVYTLYI
jgi:hypothetical protein